MSEPQEKKARATITLDAELFARVKRRVGERGVSAYLNKALRDELRHQAMREYLERAEREHGPIPQEVREAVRYALDHAYDKVDELRARRKQLSPLVKPQPPKTEPVINGLARRVKQPLEKALGRRVTIEAVGEDTLIVHLSKRGKSDRAK
jgi:Arc/MetJ family transcription regulator